MKGIISSLAEHNQYIMISIYAIIAAIIITFVVSFALKSLKFAKYLPGFALIFIGMFSIFSVANDLFNPNNLDNIVIFLITVSSGVISLLFALIIGIIQNDLGK